ncbi:hypothetical protein VTP01DRAFT_8171 [Rhizomucor pusillus]|uniref:uncharacterized protein n=1 Tax=Rhizomucor pusillus TaxID=4840 RepID=UPI0037421787
MMLTWFDTLLDYHFDVVHLPGLDNVLSQPIITLVQPSFTTGTSSNKNGPKVFRMRVISAPTDTMAPPDENRPEELQIAHLATDTQMLSTVRYLNNRGIHWNNIHSFHKLNSSSNEDLFRHSPKCGCQLSSFKIQERLDWVRKWEGTDMDFRTNCVFQDESAFHVNMKRSMA